MPTPTLTQLNTFDPAAPPVVKYLKTVNTPWKMWWYMVARLPSAAFWGFRVKSCTPLKASVGIPFRWRTQNPFRSTYFAAQCGAAEMSTGLLALTTLQGRGAISMLVTGIEATFTKKATGTVLFTCDQGLGFQEAIQRAIDTGEGQEFKALSVGVQDNGIEVTRVEVTWSFKVKSQKGK